MTLVKISKVARATVVVGTLMLSGGAPSTFGQQGPVSAEPPVATFKSSVDLVRVSAVVRDKRGRFVPDLVVGDFEIQEGGFPKTIADFRKDTGSVSVGVLFDVSGSMEAHMGSAREAATHLLSWLTAETDEAGVFTFDTQFVEVTPFTTGLRALPDTISSITPFGATSLHDAIALTAERVGKREGLRRAVVVFTDGQDTASRLSPSEVSGMASAIDVPVYIVGIVPSIDNPSSDSSGLSAARSPLAGALNDLATWTGGATFAVSTIGQRSKAAQHIVDELRHQYLIAFESSSRPGWHPLLIRARDKDYTIRARSGYIAGQSRPILD